SRLTQTLKNDILRIKAYSKNHIGKIEIDGIAKYNYKFYDEREWRLVPLKEDLNGARFSINLTDYLKDKEKYNSQLADCRFKFTHEDISYIIVKYTSEIPKMVNFIRTIYEGKLGQRELDILFSKICSAQQILEDY